MSPVDERETAERILRSFRRIAVVGLSDDPSRPSFGVASYLREVASTVRMPVSRRARPRSDCHASGAFARVDLSRAIAGCMDPFKVNGYS